MLYLNNRITLALGAIVIWLTASTASHGATATAGSRLLVEIKPEVAVIVPGILSASAETSSTDAGTTPSVAEFVLPVAIRIRLHAGASAELTLQPVEAISEVPSGVQIAIADHENLSSEAGGLYRAGWYARSGSYRESMRIRVSVATSQGPVPEYLPVRLTLRSSDGLLYWSQIVTLRWLLPALSEVSPRSLDHFLP